MSVAPSVLVLDDGELDHFQIALRRLGVDFDRRVGGRTGVAVEMPRDILLTTWRRALKMPRLQMAPGMVEEPVRVCVHGQDFLPLRERLRDEGDRGLGLRFVLLSPADREELAKLIAELKPIESLRDREGESLVVSQVISRND